MTADQVIALAEKLAEAISKDVNGLPGMPFSGNGGLVSDDTMRAADELRLAISRYRSAK